MLEANAMSNLENVSSFIGSIVSRECGESDDAPMTSVLTM